REAALVLRRYGEADLPHTPPQKAVDHVRKGRQLIDEQDVNLRPEILEAVLFLMAVTEIDFAAVPEPDFVLHDNSEARGDPGGQHGSEALGAFKVVLDEVIVHPAEKIDLQPSNGRGPHDRRSSHEMAFAAACRPAIED